MAENWKLKQKIISTKNDHHSNPTPHPEDPIEAFLSRDHPRQLQGPWDFGWALGFHSQFNGSDWTRSPIGELAFRLKYLGDFSVLDQLVNQTRTFISSHPEIAQVDAVLPVPSSVSREKDPVSSYAKAMAKQLGLVYWPVLVKSRKTSQQKQFHTLAQKKTNVA